MLRAVAIDFKWDWSEDDPRAFSRKLYRGQRCVEERNEISK